MDPVSRHTNVDINFSPRDGFLELYDNQVRSMSKIWKGKSLFS